MLLEHGLDQNANKKNADSWARIVNFAIRWLCIVFLRGLLALYSVFSGNFTARQSRIERGR